MLAALPTPYDPKFSSAYVVEALLIAAASSLLSMAINQTGMKRQVGIAGLALLVAFAVLDK